MTRDRGHINANHWFLNNRYQIWKYCCTRLINAPKIVVLITEQIPSLQLHTARPGKKQQFLQIFRPILLSWALGYCKPARRGYSSVAISSSVNAVADHKWWVNCDKRNMVLRLGHTILLNQANQGRLAVVLLSHGEELLRLVYYLNGLLFLIKEKWRVRTALRNIKMFVVMYSNKFCR